MDYASATPVLSEAISAMRAAEFLVGNPGAIHKEGVEAKAALERARSVIAAELACKSREVIFTSGLTESNDLAILGIARALDHAHRLSGTHWIVSAIEHDAVLDSFAEVERLGGKVTHIQPNKKGIIEPEVVAKEVRENTMLVSVGWANNEIGVVQPLRDIARAVKEKNENTLIHSDAGQAPLYLAPHVHTIGVDLLSIGSNKLYGPHGIGALYLSNRVSIAKILHGGKQERGLRPGTENVALAVGFAEAVRTISIEREKEKKRVRMLRTMLEKTLQERITGLEVNGDSDRSLPHMLNVSIPDIQSEYVTLALDKRGVAVSTKSACREGEESRSHVVSAISSETWRSENTIRFSLGRESNERDILRAIDALDEIIRQQK